MQINRLFQIVYLLMEQKGMTAKELAERFEVSVRTIYRDVDTLAEAGIPVYTEKGKGGGIRLMENFVLNKSLLSEQERSDILSALQSLDALKVPTSESVRYKLEAFFHKNEADWISVDFSDWGNRPGDQDKFQLLKTAILESRVIRFDYYGSKREKSQREAEPLQLWFKEKSWYLRAYCRTRNDFRIFKIMRMQNLEMTEIRFVRREPKEEPAFQNVHELFIRMRVFPPAAYRVYDDFREEDILPQPDGSFIVTCRYPEDEWLYGHLLSYGPYSEVLEPEYLRDIIREKLTAALNLYTVQKMDITSIRPDATIPSRPPNDDAAGSSSPE